MFLGEYDCDYYVGLTIGFDYTSVRCESHSGLVSLADGDAACAAQTHDVGGAGYEVALVEVATEVEAETVANASYQTDNFPRNVYIYS